MKSYRTRILFAGTLLFFLGLLTGMFLSLAYTRLENPRGVLAAHLEAVMNGTFLIGVGLFFDDLVLSDQAKARVVGLLYYGTYANWAVITIVGLTGSSGSTPISGAGHHASPLAEKIVFGALGTVVLAITLAVIGLLVGLRRKLAATP